MIRLRELRKREGLLQKDMADRFGVERTTWVKWETGNHLPGTEMLQKIADHFGVTMDYLLDRDMEGQTITVGRAAHFERSSAIVGRTKTDTSNRSIPILPPLLEALRSLHGPSRSVYVCCTQSGYIMTETAWRRAWQSYLYHMGIVGNKRINIRPHDLRHSFASLLYDAGVDVKTAQKWLGHASPEITMKIYTHLSALKEHASLEKIEAFCSAYLLPTSSEGSTHNGMEDK